MFSNLDKNRKIALFLAAILFFVKQSGFKLEDLKQLDLDGKDEVEVVDESDKLPIPPAEYIELTKPLKELFAKDPVVAMDCAYFYMGFADIVARNPGNFLQISQDFRDYNVHALDFMFENSPNKGKIPGLGEKIDEILASKIALDPTARLDHKVVSGILYAIGWTAYNEF